MFSEQVFVILKRKKSIALITEWGFTNVLSFENANQMKRSDQDKYLFCQFLFLNLTSYNQVQWAKDKCGNVKGTKIGND